jgi:uncharacterized protein YggE
MLRSLGVLAIGLVLVCLPLSRAFGQSGGNRAVLGSGGGSEAANLPLLRPELVQGYITIEGLAELRVQPTEIRIVMAVTAEGESAQKCRQAVDATIAKLKTAWSKMEISPENVAVDFIADLPRYAWSLEKHGKVEMGVERKVGYRMQSNIHLAVRNDIQAQAALNLAFEQGVTDIIGFDYWSKDLDSLKTKARQEAIQAARGKADMLLGALFAERPPIINVQEKTTVYYPESLYQTVSGREEDDPFEQNEEKKLPLLHAYRPQHTYYRGLYSDGDVQPRELPMHPEISVVSTVRLYFKSPASDRMKKVEAASKDK